MTTGRWVCVLLLAIALGVSAAEAVVTPLIVGGRLTGPDPDSPGARVDPNVPLSSFAGVGSLRIAATLGNEQGIFVCTGTPVSPIHVVTAAHCMDSDHDGVLDVTGPSKVRFRLNADGNLSSDIAVAAIDVHPSFTGFKNPDVHDDIAVLTLVAPIPASVPIYGLYRDPLVVGMTVTMVGYGRAGDGDNGFSTIAGYTVKRVGYNDADRFIPDDDGSGLLEIFEHDFDDPENLLGFLGGNGLGNTVEVGLGEGDSGGPGFVEVDGRLLLVGVNAYGFDHVSDSGTIAFPEFGSGGGSMAIHAYLDFIDGIIPEPAGAAVVLLGVMLRRNRA